MSNNHAHPIFRPLLDFIGNGANRETIDALHVMPADGEHKADPLCECKPVPEFQPNCSVLWTHR